MGYTPPMPEPSGVANPGVIDFIARSPSGATVLVMVESRTWDGSDERLKQLQDKVNAYLSFALDGQMRQQFPDADPANLVLRLDCVQAPDETVAALVPALREALKPLNVAFELNVLP